MSQNRLGQETSPYLLQHAHNPVHWWAWGPEALAEAKRSGKPILLSVGYAACHWCHVMAHESFEDEATAAVMNDLYVNIKVDREERPDIDAIYMGALHALGEQGGWPLTMFLDSEARPVWGGTYFPKQHRFGRPAFVDVLKRVAAVFREEPKKVAENARALTAAVERPHEPARGPVIDDRLLKDLTTRMVPAIDPVHGGLQGAPKFPQWSFLWLLWRGGIRYDHAPARAAVALTLDNICQGGIYDHVGGGFARYSVDERWLVPHFEKMLYDNALLIELMTEVYRETGSELYRVRVAETVEWLEREMIAAGGGFAASLDADSEGEEGKFYLWTLEDVLRVLGEDDGRFFAHLYDVTTEGNWEGHNILNRLGSLQPRSADDEARLKALRAKLLAERDKRVRPGWDDKVLADWNGLMIAALARASVVFERPAWLEVAKRAFDFVARHMSEGGRLKHAYRDGKAKAPATASDYANMIWAALRLSEATNEQRYFEQAVAWVEVLDKHYWVEGSGGYATSADDTRDVIARLRPGSDDATPNTNAIMLANLVALGTLSGDLRYMDRSAALLAAFAGDVGRNIVAHTGLLASTFDLLAPQQVVVAGQHLDGGGALMKVIRSISLPGVLQYALNDTANGATLPGLRDKNAVNQRATAYVCIGPQCSPSLTEPSELARTLKEQRSL
ncbi:MAG: thioredoxin domain-containing protein [Hyphomicrobium sp.]|uniref:thioredoxin domain-containing protein n=1 Tax=Hyphomicrobium sp. TaxID=82 RepID=UPI0013283F44|nr:thioredoxin domain-containing protein [Hyphomicrobium sp.]KAB2944123.1 MAG: thioredoxin domain-containing protein [Hyphomicrobium sp.]MBZ0209421.1 thioredoxin domain-containing protein [Hyphomicrobium sp.]